MLPRAANPHRRSSAKMLQFLIPAAASVIGGLIGNAGKNKEIENQKEFAKEGVTWRVEDARRAGVHPALALGANVPSYSPVGLGSDLAEGFSNAGQDISRAIDATSTATQKADAYVKARQSLELDNMSLQNQLLQAQILGITRPRTPPFPSSVSPAESATMPSPFGLPGITVANPELAEQSQTHFGDIMENFYGVANYIDSLARSLTGHNPNGPKPVHPTKGETHAEYLLRMKKNPMY